MHYGAAFAHELLKDCANSKHPSNRNYCKMFRLHRRLRRPLLCIGDYCKAIGPESLERKGMEGRGTLPPKPIGWPDAPLQAMQDKRLDVSGALVCRYSTISSCQFCAYEAKMLQGGWSPTLMREASENVELAIMKRSSGVKCGNRNPLAVWSRKMRGLRCFRVYSLYGQSCMKF